MKKIKKFLTLSGIALLSALIGITVRNFVILAESFDDALPVFSATQTKSVNPRPTKTQLTDPKAEANDSAPLGEGEYEVFSYEKLVGRFDTYDEALSFAKDRKESFIRQKDKSRWLWDNYPPYDVYTDSESYMEFDTFAEAVKFAKAQTKAFILYRKDNAIVWSSDHPLHGSAKINVPLINQLPELPRGCEVTSLAMLLQYKDVPTDKMTLAEQIKKDDTPYQIVNGKILYGNPNDGFVGDIYSLQGPGLGVYHRPIHELMSQYLPYSSLDLTGCNFEDMLYFLEAGAPLWVIINTSYDELPASSFETWQTESGSIQITYKEHSVLVTGYDSQFVYFNDPLGGASKAALTGFQRAWEQMGRQAVTCAP